MIVLSFVSLLVQLNCFVLHNAAWANSKKIIQYMFDFNQFYFIEISIEHFFDTSFMSCNFRMITISSFSCNSWCIC
jgi:hypothetical protein